MHHRDNSLALSNSDDSDAHFSSMDRSGQNGGAAGGERLVKPSQIKNKKRQQQPGKIECHSWFSPERDDVMCVALR